MHVGGNTAIRAMHTLKGLAATVGADHLARVAAHLEKHLRSGVPTDMHDGLLQELQTAVDASAHPLELAMQRYAQPIPMANSPAATDGMLPAMDAVQRATELTELHRLLVDSNMQALDVFAKVQQAYGSAWNQAFAPLTQAISHLDFAQAASHCAQLIQHPPA